MTKIILPPKIHPISRRVWVIFIPTILLVTPVAGFSEQDENQHVVEKHQSYRRSGITDYRWSMQGTPGEGASSGILDFSRGDRFRSFLQFEEETRRLDERTTQIVRRFYNFESEGERRPIEIAKETRIESEDGSKQITRDISTPDQEGRFTLIRREVKDVEVINPSLTRSTTTVYKPDIDGEFSASETVLATEQVSPSGVRQIETKTQLRDTNGDWKPFLRTESSFQEDPDGVQESRQSVFRKDYRGRDRLELSEQTVRHRSPQGDGGEKIVEETFSRNIGGTTRYGDGKLHLDQRLTIVRTPLSGDREQVVQELYQRNPVAPSEDLRIIERVVTISRPLPGGRTEEKIEIQARDGNRGLKTVAVRTVILEAN